MGTPAKLENQEKHLRESFISQMMRDIFGNLLNMVNSVDNEPVDEINIKDAIEQTIEKNPNEAGNLKEVEKVITHQQESQDQQALHQFSDNIDGYSDIPNKLNNITANVSEQQAINNLSNNSKNENQITLE